MQLNDLFRAQGIDPEKVLVLRHRPSERALNRVMPWLAAEHPELFNAYQQFQGPRLEKAMQTLSGRGHVASFLARGSGRALFVGLYSIGGSQSLSREQFLNCPEIIALMKHGMHADGDTRDSILRFDLVRRTDFYDSWKGRLVIEWPPPGLSWWRRAHRNENKMPILAILEDSALDAAMPDWDELNLMWGELEVLPERWKVALRHWRGIYYIFDSSDCKGYVGSAYGGDNILGRWEHYRDTGHGGNSLLLKRNPHSFHFTILQRVSPDMPADDVVRLESTWKERLHTRAPYGLNDN